MKAVNALRKPIDFHHFFYTLVSRLRIKLVRHMLLEQIVSLTPLIAFSIGSPARALAIVAQFLVGAANGEDVVVGP
jgi:hypothetical protein